MIGKWVGLKKHTDRVFCMITIGDGHTIVSYSEDDTVRVWDVDSGECLHVLTHHDMRDIRSMVDCGDGENIIVSCENGINVVWNIDSGECVNTTKFLYKME